MSSMRKREGKDMSKARLQVLKGEATKNDVITMLLVIEVDRHCCEGCEMVKE